MTKEEFIVRKLVNMWGNGFCFYIDGNKEIIDNDMQKEFLEQLEFEITKELSKSPLGIYVYSSLGKLDPITRRTLKSLNALYYFAPQNSLLWLIPGKKILSIENKKVVTYFALKQ